MADTCFVNEKYLSHHFHEVILLVSSNLLLLLPFWKAYILHEYLRAFIYLCSFFFSSSYHLCKTAGTDGSACLLPLCSLKLLDYTFSYTILMASFLYFLDFGVVYKYLKKYHKHSKRLESKTINMFYYGPNEQNDTTYQFTKPNLKLKRKENLIQPDMSYIEDWIIFCSILYNSISVSENEFNPLTYTQLGIGIGVIWAVVIIGWIYNYITFKISPYFDVKDLIIALILAVIGVFLFIIEDYIPSSTYWITHTLWHIFAAVSQLYLLEARNFKKSGWNVCCIDRLNEY